MQGKIHTREISKDFTGNIHWTCDHGLMWLSHDSEETSFRKCDLSFVFNIHIVHHTVHLRWTSWYDSFKIVLLSPHCNSFEQHLSILYVFVLIICMSHSQCYSHKESKLPMVRKEYNLICCILCMCLNIKIHVFRGIEPQRCK